MAKRFDDLTIADDFMFCKVMQNEGICKEFLEMVLSDKIGKIVYLSPQNSVATGIEAKSVRLDVFVKDETGKSYDIEMAFSDRRPCLSENTSFSSEKLAHTHNFSGVLAGTKQAARMPLKLNRCDVSTSGETRKSKVYSGGALLTTLLSSGD